MEGLVLVLWALLVGRGAVLLQRGPGTAPQTQPGVNLTCYQCFKVTTEGQCRPKACSSTDQVCVSQTVINFFQWTVRTMLSKRCAPRCPNGDMTHEWLMTSGVAGRIVRGCCSRSLCNAVPPTPGGPLLPLGLSLFRVLL